MARGRDAGAGWGEAPREAAAGDGASSVEGSEARTEASEMDSMSEGGESLAVTPDDERCAHVHAIRSSGAAMPMADA